MSSYSFSVDYDFEDLSIFFNGLRATGTAVLTHDQDGEFYVSEITLAGGSTLRRSGNPAFGTDFTKRLFVQIAIEIENDAHAQEFFLNAFREGSDAETERPYSVVNERQQFGAQVVGASL